MERVLDQVVEDDREVLLGGVDDSVICRGELQTALLLLGAGLPALLRVLGGEAERHQPAACRALPLAGQHEQRVQQSGEPLDLLLGGGQLPLEVRALGLRRGRLEAQP